MVKHYTYNLLIYNKAVHAAAYQVSCNRCIEISASYTN